jgi:PAS domain S-box-containing protein
LLNKAQQVSHVGSWVWHVPTNRLEFSNEMFRIFGIGRDKFVADIIRLVGQAIHADDRARVQRAMLSAIKERTPIPLECRILRPDGTIRVIRAEPGELILDNEGQPLVVTGIAQDITEQKQSENTLLESEARYRTLVENANDAIIVAQEGLLKFANRRTSEITGYSHEEIAGKPFAGFIHPDDRQMVVNNYASRLRGEKVPKNYVFRIVGKTGKEVWAEINAVLIQWQGRPATLNFLSDITERKQAEERIQTLMREIEFILGATKTTLDIIDPKFNLRFVDPASKKARGNWPGRKCYDYFMGRRSPCSNCGMSQALRTKEMVVSEVVLLQEGQRPVQIISIPFQDEKGEWLVAEVSVDITERKRAEEALLASREELRLLTARLQSLREEERTYLAREIHDELGQALTALNMDLAWLAGKLPKSQPQLLKKAESMTAVVASTMQTVKRLSSELRPGLLDDLGLVAAMQWQAEEFGKRTWLKMKLVFQPEEMTVERDLSTAIFRIFQELLTNIARHAKATRVEVSLKRRARALELRVKDNGRGIKKSEISGSRSLGLIGVRERALVFGGQVEITGVPHKGTRVVVRLPERGRNDGKNSGG